MPPMAKADQCSEYLVLNYNRNNKIHYNIYTILYYNISQNTITLTQHATCHCNF